MTDKEKYFWDLNGYLIVRNVLSQEEIAEVNEALNYSQRGVKDTVEETGGNSLKGTSARWYSGENLLNLLHPHCEPFRNLLAHPAVVERLVQMCGPGVRLDHGRCGWRSAQ